MLFLVMRRGFQMKALAHHGVRVQGTVIKKFRRGSGGQSAPYIRYEYNDSVGSSHQHKIVVSEAFWEQHEKGQPIEIVYVPDKPSISSARYLVDQARQTLKLPPLE